jgi:hypothetical protein
MAVYLFLGKTHFLIVRKGKVLFGGEVTNETPCPPPHTKHCAQWAFPPLMRLPCLKTDSLFSTHETFRFHLLRRNLGHAFNSGFNGPFPLHYRPLMNPFRSGPVVSFLIYIISLTGSFYLLCKLFA